MSVSYYTTPVYGILIPKKMIFKETKNPLFNPDAPYDPKTGNRIEKIIVTKIDIDWIASQQGLSAVETTDGDTFFVGVAGKSVCVGEGGNEFSKLPDFNKEMIDQKLMLLCKEYGYDANSIGFYSVGYCSY